MAGNKFSARDKNPFQLPSEYKFLKVVGEGGFGKVLKCRRKETKDIVAIKIPKFLYDSRKEVSMLKNFMDLNLDQCNIVKFIDWFDIDCGQAMVFEMLDISLDNYILKNCCAPLLLTEIRSIIQQMAIAFNALKSVGVIHTDIKPDNIMLVDHQRRPLRAKLIDFGLAIPKSEAKPGMSLQIVLFRSPEIILGLPFSEAIDMWSLGSVMATMILGFVLFPVEAEYEALQLIGELLGQLADHILKHGRKTHKYFNWTETNSWRLKTPEEYWGKYPPKEHTSTKYPYCSLDDMKRMRLERTNSAEADEREQCIELLKAMLMLDETDRITPSEVLNHPFITKSYPSSHDKASKSADAQCSRKKDKRGIKAITKKTVESTNGGFRPAPTKLPSSPILVRPAAAIGILRMESYLESDVSLQTLNKMSRSASWASLCEDWKPPATTNAHPDHRNPSPTDPPTGVIMVQPAAAENTLQLEEQESAVSFQAELHMKSEYLVKIIESDTATGTSEDPPTFDDTRTKRKKRKTRIRRVFSWMKRTFCSCWTCIDEDEEGDRLF